MTKNKKITLFSFFIVVALAFALLFTLAFVPAQAYAESTEVELSVGELLSEEIPERSTCLLDGDIADFQSVSAEVASTWTGAPAGMSILLYAGNDDHTFRGYCYLDGAYQASFDTFSQSCDDLRANVEGGELRVFYTRDAQGDSSSVNADQEAADAAAALISAIGTVTHPGSKDAINAAREGYDALTAVQKALVDNLDVLEQAEAAFAGQHTYTFFDATVTCTTDGMVAYLYCEECDSYFDVVKVPTTVAALQRSARHNLVHYDLVEPTCTTMGKKEYFVCSDCEKTFNVNMQEVASNQMYTLNISSLGHNYDGENAVFTWTEADNSYGWTATAAYSCTRCGTVVNQNATVTTKSATFNEDSYLTAYIYLSQNSKYTYYYSDEIKYRDSDIGTATKNKWTPWEYADHLPTEAAPSGSQGWYLTEDVTLTETWSVPASMALCLNGHVITMTGSGSAIYVPLSGSASGRNFTLCEYNFEDTHYYYIGKTVTDSHGNDLNFVGQIVDDENDPAYIAAARKGSFTGGYVTGGTGRVDGDSTYGGAVYVEGNSSNSYIYSSKFSMEGGTLFGNTADIGGAVYVATNAYFEMKGANIIGNQAGSEGGGVYANRREYSTTYPDMNYGMSTTLNTIMIAHNTAGQSGNGYGGGIAGWARLEYSYAKVFGNLAIGNNAKGGAFYGFLYATEPKVYENYVVGTNAVGPGVYVTNQNLCIGANGDIAYFDNYYASAVTVNEITLTGRRGDLYFASGYTMSLHDTNYPPRPNDGEKAFVEMQAGTGNFATNWASDYYTAADFLAANIGYQVKESGSTLSLTTNSGNVNVDTTKGYNIYTSYYKVNGTNTVYTSDESHRYVFSGTRTLGSYYYYIHGYNKGENNIYLRFNNLNLTAQENYTIFYISSLYGDLNLYIELVGDNVLTTNNRTAAAISGNKEYKINVYFTGDGTLTYHNSATEPCDPGRLSHNFFMTYDDVRDVHVYLGGEDITVYERVAQKIQEIDWQITFTNTVKERITAARTAYDALESDELREKVVNRDYLFYAELAYKQAAVQDVITAIDFIPYPVAYTSECKDKIDYARGLYDNLGDEELIAEFNPDIPQELVTNRHILFAAESAYATIQVDIVKEKIDNIPKPINADSKDAIDEARELYDDLPEDKKGDIDNYGDLLDAEAAYELTVLISNIDTPVYHPASKDQIDAARAAYDDLTEEQKALVADYQDLLDAEAAYEVDVLISLIDDPLIYPTSKDKIDAARAAYDDLTEEQKALVGDYQTLLDAEEAYAILKANNEAADVVEALIDLIGHPVAYTPECEDAISEARAAYDDLTEEQKALVDNANVILEGRVFSINNLQGTIKRMYVVNTDTIGSIKDAAASLFSVSADEYKFIFNGEDLNDADTVASADVPDGSTLSFVPIAGGLKTLTLVPSVSADRQEVAPGVYSELRAGDTITITYRSTQNSGFSEAVFTTAFNEEYLHLTAFSVDETYYSILSDYGIEDGDTYVPMTFAEWIAAHNAALDAGETPYSELLSLSIEYTGGMKDTVGVLSESFLTVTYTVVKDVPAGTTLNFGFDMSLDGEYTNAAYNEDILLNIIDAEGATVDEEMVTITVMNVTTVVIPEDQVLTFHHTDDDYFVDIADIEMIWVQPTFGEQEENPYLADGGSVTYTFYSKNGNEYEPISGVPTAVGDYYVKAILPETDTYLGYETDYVAISVAKILVDVPDLKLYAGEDSSTPTYDDHILGITKGGVTYGTTLTLKEIVDSEEADYALPATSGSVQELTYTFLKADGNDWTAVDNFFLSQPLTVGTYKLTIAPKNGDYVAFDADPAVDAITIEISIIKKSIEKPDLPVEYKTYNGASQSYSGSGTDYTITGSGTNAGSYPVTLALIDKDNTEWNDNTVADYEAADKLVINKKTVTLTVTKSADSSEYHSPVATITVNATGIVSEGDLGTISYQAKYWAGSGYQYYTKAEFESTDPYPIASNYVLEPTYTVNDNYSVSVQSSPYEITVKLINVPAYEDTYDYDGQEHHIVLTDPSQDNAQYYELSPNPYETSIGEYDAYLVLKAEYAGGIAWNDENHTTADKHLTLTIRVVAVNFHIVPVCNNVEKDAVEVSINVLEALPAATAYRWFKFAGYTFNNAAATSATLAMNGETVYANYTYNVGAGDVDGDGVISSADVILMNRWNVGLDRAKKVVDAADAWAKADDESFLSGVLCSALDANSNGSVRSNDVVAVREALATGHAYKVIVSEGITQVAKVDRVTVTAYNDLLANIALGNPVTLGSDIDAANEIFNVDSAIPVDIDLGTHRLTVKGFTLNTATAGATLKITNGTLYTVTGIQITAPNGNVVVANVNGYSYDGTVVNLAAYSESLHIEDTVAFYIYKAQDPVTGDDYADVDAFVADVYPENIEQATTQEITALNTTITTLATTRIGETEERMADIAAIKADTTKNETQKAEAINALDVKKAIVEVPVDTHVVVEEAASLSVDKVVVKAQSDTTAEAVTTFAIEVKNAEAELVTVDISEVKDDSGEETVYVVEEVAISGASSQVEVVKGANTAADVKKYVAQIGNTSYETLQAAINAAQNADTIKLIADVADGTGLVIPDNTAKSITIDFNGKTYTVVGPAVGSTGTETQAMHWSNNSTVTLKNGTFVVSEQAATVAGSNGKIVKMAMQNYANLTVKDMTMDFSNIVVRNYGDYTGTIYEAYTGLEISLFNINAGSLTMEGSTITMPNDSTKGICISVAGATITNSTINGAVSLNSEDADPSVTVTGSTITKGVVPYFAADMVGAKNGVWTIVDAIEVSTFAELKAAIADVNAGTLVNPTLYIANDIAFEEELTISKSLTILGDGETKFIGYDAVGSYNDAFYINTSAADQTVTIQGIVFDHFCYYSDVANQTKATASGAKNGVSVITYAGACHSGTTLNIIECEVIGTGRDMINASSSLGCAGTINITDCTFDATDRLSSTLNMLSFYGKQAADLYVTIENCIFSEATEANTTWATTAIASFGNAVITVDGCTFEDCQVAIGIDNTFDRLYSSVTYPVYVNTTCTLNDVTYVNCYFGYYEESIVASVDDIPEGFELDTDSPYTLGDYEATQFTAYEYDYVELGTEGVDAKYLVVKSYYVAA